MKLGSTNNHHLAKWCVVKLTPWDEGDWVLTQQDNPVSPDLIRVKKRQRKRSSISMESEITGQEVELPCGWARSEKTCCVQDIKLPRKGGQTPGENLTLIWSPWEFWGLFLKGSWSAMGSDNIFFPGIANLEESRFILHSCIVLGCLWSHQVQPGVAPSLF